MTDSSIHLILQSPDLSADRIEQAAALACANGVRRISTTAARLTGVAGDEASRKELADWCASRHMDYAYVPGQAKLSDYRVLAMDMDSTLINIECIDEIADAVGRKPEVAAITEAAMRGEIKDFSESLRRRVALLQGVAATALEEVYADRLKLNPGAERLVESARAAGLKILLVSGGFTFFTERLRQRLQLDAAHANTLEVNDSGILTGRVLGDIVDAQAKARLVQQFAASHGAQTSQAIVIGDGANDLQMMKLAGISVAYRAKPVVQQQASHALNYTGLDGVLNWFAS
ncbi:phosphoserine phosphatase SerB [Kerstersia gyiorum]|uniref:Phosphoserine phosphatase n=1 Tax=Kerstersia gyiorum TaxID=206506 RepID=A0A4Q7MY48_9BURK|nr:phosphoserine phosphatase SerB [Kerstersia gyiorum]KAB0541884.1 phosphoserine phosphatase SerB [Kerstersia gyiorum]MCP1632438.1 phosphoserine phosphatase [Kerstersia gyiorum]MCP1635055.1 phosphoserine phosphatase [Kerstersia gyiorum]MCP1670018.1 phosphoserine phosphatase [Kerstersia gyiorum]MCP1678159.1 phosphoserine phosphatase [Kerstersia gyiorum]